MDKYYVYRPLLNLISKFEGTAKGSHPKAKGYNTTLSYDAYTGPVVLTKMTIVEVLKLQAKMLKHPDNKWNSSAIGNYQIVSRTMRGIISNLKLDTSLLFNEDTQDKMACYLLGVRGIDKYLSGRMKEDTLLINLSAEWASFPKPDGTGTYKGQGVGGKVSEVRKALQEVKKRHKNQQPNNIPKEFEEEVEKEIKTTTSWVGGIFGSSGLGLGVLAVFKDFDWTTIITLFGSGILFTLLFLLVGQWAIKRIKEIKRAYNE